MNEPMIRRDGNVRRFAAATAPAPVKAAPARTPAPAASDRLVPATS